ncbi:MAG: glycosyltransferase family 39 protein [Desulfobacterales bacterium]|nr:glycosyltransferase family 39 protein [Desulfobacterales bacterium]
MAATVAAVLLMAAVPPVSRDALNHHLLVPKLYLAAGEIYEIPEITFSYYPMTLEMLYLGAMWLGSDILPKYIHFAFALLTAVSMHRYLKRRFDATWAAVGVCLFLTLPVMMKLSVTVYVDLGLIFFSWMALVHFLYWQEEGWRFKEFMISAVCCGLALGVKYNGMVTLFILAAFVTMAYARSHAGKPRAGLKAFGFGALYVAVAAAVFSPWWLRNLLWTGNPVYPLMKSFFNLLGSTGGSPAATEVTDLFNSGLSHFTYRALIYGESGWEIVLIPLRIFFQGADNMPQFFDGVLHPFLLVLPVVALLGIDRSNVSWRRDAGYLSIFAVLTILIVFFQTDMRIRYVAPMIPALVVLSVGGLRSIIVGLESRLRSLPWRGVILPLVIIALMVPNAIYTRQLFASIDPISLITGKIDRKSYITARRPEFALFDYANRHLDDRAHLLSLFLSRRHYYCDIPITEANSYFLRAVRQAPSGEDLAEALAAVGYTHLVFNDPLLNRWLVDNLTDRQKAVAKDFFSHWTSAVYHHQGYRLLAVRPPPGS